MARKPTLQHPADRTSRKDDPTRPWARAAGEPTVYNPEDWPAWMEKLGETTMTQEAFRKRMMIPTQLLKEGKIQVRGRFAIVSRVVGGRLVESERSNDGKEWRLKVGTRESTRHGVRDGWIVESRQVRDAGAFQRLSESNEWATAKILESWDSFSYDGDGFGGQGQVGPPNDEFIPLMGGPFSKNLYLYDYLDMQAKCFWMKNHHPLAKACITTLRNYTIGKGIDVLAKSPECQKLWDDFVKRTRYDRKLRDDVTTLIWGGETMDLKGKDSRGLARLTSMDTSTVWEVVTDPANIDDVLYYHQQYPTQWQLVYKSSDIPTEYIINDIPADQVIHLKENVTPGEKRGRSDLFPVLSDLKRYKDYKNAKVIKAQLEESYGLDIEVDGSQADVDAILANNQAMRVPRAGTARVHNKAVVYKYLQPTTSSTGGKDDTGELLRKDIAVGMGIAPEWIGETGAGSSRANSLVKEAPATRTIEDKQLKVEDMVRSAWDYVMQTDGAALPAEQVRKANLGGVKRHIAQRNWKGAIGELGKLATGGTVTEPLDKGMEVIFPEISKDDRSGKIVDVLKGQIAGFITHERASAMYAKEMAINNYDYDDEMKAAQAEADSGRGPEWQQDATTALAAKGAQGAGGAAGGAAGAPKDGSQAGGAGLRQGDGK
jgi:hypothetical protein